MCPLCIAPLQRISRGTRFSRQCEECKAVEHRSLACISCGNAKLWRGAKGVACKRCGQFAANLDSAGWILRRDLYAEPDLRRALCDAFPELADEVRESTGASHLQFGSLAQWTDEAAKARDEALLRRAFDFADDLAKRRSELHPEILNALYVSYLEHVALDADSEDWVLERMPPILRDMRRHVLQHLEDLLEGPAPSD